VLAWNLAKCFVHRGGWSFASKDEVEARLHRIAAVIRAENPDLVFLSELVIECTPCDVDQLLFIARGTGLEHWVFGENFNFGLPFFRIVSGNAILARDALEPVANSDLVGRQPFWVTRNNRRVLFARARIAGEAVLLGSLHTDSFDFENNLRQTRQILAFEPSTPTLLAGDFNAEPTSASLAEIVGSKRFTGALDGPITFPADATGMRIDYIFGPAQWRLVDSRVLEDESSDHRAVVSTFVVRR
jgi:endonuclease/exonuclease/phosphatase family metal-dependent hydrolase